MKRNDLGQSGIELALILLAVVTLSIQFIDYIGEFTASAFSMSSSSDMAATSLEDNSSDGGSKGTAGACDEKVSDSFWLDHCKAEHERSKK